MTKEELKQEILLACEYLIDMAHKNYDKKKETYHQGGFDYLEELYEEIEKME
ncbi:hypothetical protein ACO0K2_18005 [Undibacterium sp. MH2W]|uniref:hypothetical protein n=1 Tax=Undibacterium sp. MH2W TaxID=3413044 RepID=UPI003BF27E75